MADQAPTTMLTVECGPHCVHKDQVTRHCTRCHDEFLRPMADRPLHDPRPRHG